MLDVPSFAPSTMMSSMNIKKWINK
jgi:hypothetical protein